MGFMASGGEVWRRRGLAVKGFDVLLKPGFILGVFQDVHFLFQAPGMSGMVWVEGFSKVRYVELGSLQ